MRTLSMLIVFTAIAACQLKSAGGTDTSSSSSSTTAGIDPSWAVGLYFRPGDGSPTAALATIDVRPDRTAELSVQSCGVDGSTVSEVGWEPLDDDSIAFISLDASEPLRWFGTPPVGVTVTLSRTDQEKAFHVTDGKTSDNFYMGEFRSTSKPMCLVLVEPHLGCADGAYVRSCPDA